MGRDEQGPSGPGDALASTSAPGGLQPPLSQDFRTGRRAAPSRGTGGPGSPASAQAAHGPVLIRINPESSSQEVPLKERLAAEASLARPEVGATRLEVAPEEPSPRSVEQGTPPTPSRERPGLASSHEELRGRGLGEQSVLKGGPRVPAPLPDVSRQGTGRWPWSRG